MFISLDCIVMGKLKLLFYSETVQKSDIQKSDIQ